MQIQLVIEDVEEMEEKNCSVICLKSSSSISSWMIEYYFTEIFSQQIQTTNKSLQPKNIIGSWDMWMIFRRIQPSISRSEFLDLCKKKLNRINDDSMLGNYNNYLNRCSLFDIIDLFHQYRLDSSEKTMLLSMKNIKNDIDRLFFEYLVELPNTSCAIYDIKAKSFTTETRENVLQLIDSHQTVVTQPMNSKNDLKHTLCTHLSLLLDTRNEHALIHCLLTAGNLGIKRETIIELQCLSKLSKNDGLTIYQILLSLLRRKELTSTHVSSSLQHDLTTNTDQLLGILDKSYDGIKEFFNFIEQLRMIIEDNEHSKIELSVTLHKLLELISKQLRKDKEFSRYDPIIEDVIEELCQCFQTTISLMNCTSPMRSASSGATLAGRRFLRSLAYLCAKQTIDLPVMLTNNGIPSGMVNEIKVANHPKTIRKYRSLDLSIIHETSFESNSSIDHHRSDSNNQIQPKTMVKRQPLREIDINSFNVEERAAEYEKTRSQHVAVFSLVSDGDKENLPMITKKRPTLSTRNDLPNKKHKKSNLKTPEVGQKMITSFFQSTN